jgi:hypothetical protein
MTPILEALIQGHQVRQGFEREARAKQAMQEHLKQQDLENRRQDARDLLDILNRARPVQDGMIQAPMRTPFYDPVTGADTGGGAVTNAAVPVDQGRVVSVGGRQFEALRPDEIAGQETQSAIARLRSLLPVQKEQALEMGMVAPEIDKRTRADFGELASPDVVQALGLPLDRKYTPAELTKLHGTMAELFKQAHLRDLEAKTAEQRAEAQRKFTSGENELNRKTQAQLAADRNKATLTAAALRGRSGGGGGAGSAGASSAAGSDPASDIAGAIMRGEQPPETKGLYGKGAAVRAILAKSGYNLMQAQGDWQATQRHLATLNGPQQERLRQAITFTHDSLGQIEDLYSQWQKLGPASGFKVLNRASLAVAKHLPGETGAVATNLEAQINDLSAELATVYKGGNSGTDLSMKKAAENLKADWNELTFRSALKQIRTNLTIRKNSLMSSEPAGLSTRPSAEPVAPSGPPPGAPVAVNPKTGQRVFFDGKEWKPL